MSTCDSCSRMGNTPHGRKKRLAKTQLTSKQVRILKAIADSGCNLILCSECPLEDMRLCNILMDREEVISVARSLLDELVGNIIEE